MAKRKRFDDITEREQDGEFTPCMKCGAAMQKQAVHFLWREFNVADGIIDRQYLQRCPSCGGMSIFRERVLAPIIDLAPAPTVRAEGSR